MWRDPLLHPLTLASMALLAVNDHWAKAAYGTWFTGKLSDFAGLVFFPLLVELLPVGAGIVGRRRAVWITALGFTLVKTLPAATAAWNALFGAVYQAIGWGDGARLICDPTDLIALSALVLPLFLIPPADGSRIASSSSQPAS